MLDKMNVVRLKAEHEAAALQEEIQRTLREAEAERQTALNSMVQGAAARLGGQVAKVTTLGRAPREEGGASSKEPHTPHTPGAVRGQGANHRFMLERHTANVTLLTSHI